MVHLGWPYHSILAPDRLGTGRRHPLSQVDDHPLDVGTLSPALHTSPLPERHGRIGYWWQNTRFVLDFVQLEQLLTQLRIAHTVLHRWAANLAWV